MWGLGDPRRFGDSAIQKMEILEKLLGPKRIEDGVWIVRSGGMESYFEKI